MVTNYKTLMWYPLYLAHLPTVNFNHSCYPVYENFKVFLMVVDSSRITRFYIWFQMEMPFEIINLIETYSKKNI